GDVGGGGGEGVEGGAGGGGGRGRLPGCARRALVALGGGRRRAGRCGLPAGDADLRRPRPVLLPVAGGAAPEAARAARRIGRAVRSAGARGLRGPGCETVTAMTDRPDIFARELRRIVLEQSKRANLGHIRSALSIADLVAVLYCGVLRGAGTDDGERDRFVLSKGHAALALYAALHLRGVLNDGELETFCGDGTLLGTHPERELHGIDFTSGSLGQGLSTACGAALAARLDGSSRRVFCLLSDA